VILEAFLPGTAPTSEAPSGEIVGGGTTAYYDPEPTGRPSAPSAPPAPAVTGDGLY
jgi:hypothetical protein